MKNEQNETKMRFTTIISPSILTKIKLISYFTNSKISLVVEDSLNTYLLNFEKQNNIQINDLMRIKDKFQNDESIIEEINEIGEELKKIK